MNRFLVTYVKGWSYLWQMNLLRVWGFADAADKVESFFSPANLFVQRWLPLFYVPSLVVVPLAVKGISAAEGAKIGAILGIYLHPSPTSLTSCNESTVFDFPILVLNIWHPIATSNLPSVPLVTCGELFKDTCTLNNLWQWEDGYAHCLWPAILQFRCERWWTQSSFQQTLCPKQLPLHLRSASLGLLLCCLAFTWLCVIPVHWGR